MARLEVLDGHGRFRLSDQYGGAVIIGDDALVTGCENLVLSSMWRFLCSLGVGCETAMGLLAYFDQSAHYRSSLASVFTHIQEAVPLPLRNTSEFRHAFDKFALKIFEGEVQVSEDLNIQATAAAGYLVEKLRDATLGRTMILTQMPRPLLAYALERAGIWDACRGLAIQTMPHLLEHQEFYCDQACRRLGNEPREILALASNGELARPAINAGCDILVCPSEARIDHCVREIMANICSSLSYVRSRATLIRNWRQVY